MTPEPCPAPGPVPVGEKGGLLLPAFAKTLLGGRLRLEFVVHLVCLYIHFVKPALKESSVVSL